MWHDHDIDFARWLHPAMWHVALGSWQWIRHVAAPCNVAGGSGMTCHGIRPNVRHVGILHLVSILAYHCSLHVILQQSAKFHQNWTTLSRKKMTLCRFSKWRMSAILDFRGPIMGSLKSRCTTFYSSWIATIDLNCLVFEKIAFFCILATNKQTDKQMDSIDALSRSRYRERRLKNCWNKENWRSIPCPTKEYTTNAVQQISQIFIRDAIKLEWQD